MARDSVRSGFVVLVGVVMVGFWSVLYLTGQVPELATAPYEIGYHLVAEVATALALVAAGVGRVTRRAWAARLYPVALGALGYTVVNSAGYYAQQGDLAMVAMFTTLTVATLLLVGEYVTGRVERRSGSDGRTGEVRA